MTNKNDYDWAKAVYDLAVDQSNDINKMIKAANLDPKTGDLIDLDLSNLNLSNQDLSGWDLSKADFTNTTLVNTNLKGAKIDPNKLLQSNSWMQAKLDDETRWQTVLLERGILSNVSLVLIERIRSLGLSDKAIAIIERDNIMYIGDLVQKTPAELHRMPDVDREVSREISRCLELKGLRLGMEIPDWPPENIEELTNIAGWLYVEGINQ